MEIKCKIFKKSFPQRDEIADWPFPFSILWGRLQRLSAVISAQKGENQIKLSNHRQQPLIKKKLSLSGLMGFYNLWFLCICISVIQLTNAAMHLRKQILPLLFSNSVDGFCLFLNLTFTQLSHTATALANLNKLMGWEHLKSKQHRIFFSIFRYPMYIIHPSISFIFKLKTFLEVYFTSIF